MDFTAVPVSSRKAVDYFDNHAAYYEESQYRTSRRTFINSRHDQIVRMLADLAVPRTAAVLDAGCGPGNLLSEFARRFSRVWAVDASPRMVEAARANAGRNRGVSYGVANIEALPFDRETFDVVCSAGVIEYLPHLSRALEEMHRVLRPGGLLILPTTNAVAPAHWLRPLLDPIARVRIVARAFGIQPGDYQLRYYRIPEFKECVRAAGLVIERERHFYFTLPRPLDRMLPAATRNLESFFDRYMHTGVRHLAEGYIAVARKPPAHAIGR